MSEALDIGEVVARSGVPVSTLHVWERYGVITPMSRRGLRRQYGPEVLHVIALVVVCQRAGFTLDEIRAVQRDGGPGEDPERLRGRLREKLADVLAQRDQIDQTIAALRLAIDCTHPSPLVCPVFGERLDAVLPVRGRRDHPDGQNRP